MGTVWRQKSSIKWAQVRWQPCRVFLVMEVLVAVNVPSRGDKKDTKKSLSVDGTPVTHRCPRLRRSYRVFCLPITPTLKTCLILLYISESVRQLKLS